MAWTLNPSDLDLLVSLSPEEFGGDRAEWGLCLAQVWALKGDSARARVYADSGLAAYEELIRANPRNDQAYALVGLTLAYLGRYDEAVASTRRAIALHGTDQDKYAGAYNELEARPGLCDGGPA